MKPAAIQEVVDAYLAAVSAGDVDAIMALYADDARVEDPVGSDEVVGSVAIREFYERACAIPMRASPSGPAGITDSAVAFPFELVVGDGDMRIAIIDVFHLNDAGLIRSMRAYWGPGNVG